MTAARRKDGSKDSPSDSMPARTANIRPPLASRTCAARREERDDHRQPEQLEQPEMNNPEITSTRVLTGTSRKTRKSVQPDGWFPPPLREHTDPALQHAIDASVEAA